MPNKRYLSLKSCSILFTAWLALSLFLNACVGNVPETATSTPAHKKTAQPVPTYTSSTRPTRTSTPSEPPTPTIGELKGTQIQFWHPWSGELAALMSQLTDEFNQTNVWGISVAASAPGGIEALGEQLEGASANGQLPDVVAASSEQLIAWQEKSQRVIDLNRYLPNSTFGLTPEDKADFARVFWDEDLYNGQQLGIPGQLTASVIFYNQSWAEYLGFQEPPGNPEEFKAQACAAAQANMKDARVENDGTGGWIVENDSLSMLSWLTAFEAQVDPGTGSQPYNFDNEQVRSTFSYLRQLFDKSCAWSGKNQTPYDYFSQRQALFYSGVLQDILPQARAMERQKNSDRWMVLPYPTDSKKPAVITNETSYAILHTTAKKQLAAWLFIKWLILPRHVASVVETSGTIPTRMSAYEMLTDFQKQYPAWTGTQLWLPLARPAPRQPSWLSVSSILEDAGWQVFQPNFSPTQIPQVVQQIDQLIPEVLQKNP